MNRIAYVLLSCVTLLLTACHTEEWTPSAPSGSGAMRFRIQCAAYGEEATRSDLRQNTDYDRVAFCVVDGSGAAVTGIKGLYDRNE